MRKYYVYLTFGQFLPMEWVANINEVLISNVGKN